MVTSLKASLAGAVSLVLTGFWAVPAYAGVSTSAALGVSENAYGIVYDYNAGPYTTNIGTYISDTCNGRPGCSATGSGTIDATGTLTSSSDQVTLSLPVQGPNRFGEYAAPQSGSASANAYLATGTVGVSATGTFSDIFASGGQDGVTARGVATVSDGLHFTVAGAASGTVTDIGVTFTVHGTVVQGSQTQPYWRVSSLLQFGGAEFNSALDFQVGTATFSDSASNWVSYGYASNTVDDIVFEGIYALTGPSTDLGIYEVLDAGCGGGVACDFAHTGAVSLSLPDGVSLTSDSGVFLTGSNVPEPGSLALLSAGLALTATFRRRRGNSPPFIAIRAADDCGSLQIPVILLAADATPGTMPA